MAASREPNLAVKRETWLVCTSCAIPHRGATVQVHEMCSSRDAITWKRPKTCTPAAFAPGGVDNALHKRRCLRPTFLAQIQRLSLNPCCINLLGSPSSVRATVHPLPVVLSTLRSPRSSGTRAGGEELGRCRSTEWLRTGCRGFRELRERGGQGSSALQSIPAQLCGERRVGDAAETGWGVEFKRGSWQIRDAFQECWEACPKKKTNLQIKGAFIMKENPWWLQGKEKPRRASLLPDPRREQAAAAEQNQAGPEAKALPGNAEGAARWQTSSRHQQSQDVPCETASEVSTCWKRKQKLFIHYFYFILISVAQQRSQKALAGLWDAPEINKKLWLNKCWPRNYERFKSRPPLFWVFLPLHQSGILKPPQLHSSMP